MHRMTIAALAVLIAGSVAAQEPGWNFRGSLYGWVPSLSATMGTRFGDLETEANGSNALSALDVAFMGTIEARKGQWGFIGDLLYVDLSSDTDAPFGLRFDGSTLETKTSAFSGYAVYRAYESDRAIIDAGVGLRAFSLDVDLGLKSADARPDYDANESETWAVPVIATRFIFPFNESWFATAFFDGGMTSSDTSTWQAFGSVGYRFNDRWSTQVGWRYMDVQKDVGDLDVSLDLSGPLIGVSASF